MDWALPLALGLCAVSAAYYAAKLRQPGSYRVQIRIGFLVIAGMGAVPGFGTILWLPLLGTTSQLLFGICPMARSLDLMPWNREEALDWEGFAAILTRPPGQEEPGDRPSPGRALQELPESGDETPPRAPWPIRASACVSCPRPELIHPRQGTDESRRGMRTRETRMARTARATGRSAPPRPADFSCR